MMQFFGTIVTKEDPMDLELDEGDIFHLTHAMIDPRSTGKGKVYVQAVISLMEEEEFEEEKDEDSQVENEIRIPICMLEQGKTEQVSLDLHFNFEQIVRFELVGQEGSPTTVALTGSMITMEQGGCQDEDCEDDHCGINHEDDEELDSDAEEFEDSMDEIDEDDEDLVDEDDEDEIPTLIPAKNTKQTKGKITEIVEQPKKQATIPDKAAANKPAAKKAPAKPEQPSKKQQAQQSPAKPPQANNKKRAQPQNENNKKKQKN